MPSDVAAARRVEAFLFDLDGTLADTRDDIAFSLNHVLARLKRAPHSPDDVARFIGDGFRTTLARALGTDEPGRVDEALALFSPHYEEHCAERTVLYPGVKETLARLASKDLAVVTNKPAAHTRRTLAALGIDRFFREIVAGDALPVRKPRPEPLLEAARRLAAEPARTLMVGDSPGDIAAGKAAGTLTCGVTYGYRPAAEVRAAAPDFVVDRFSEIPSLIGGAR